MAIWNIDLTTEDGAVGAAGMGGVACFITAGLTLLGLALTAATAKDQAALLGAAVGIVAEFLIFLVAGFRLRAGRGLIWGSVAALLMLLEIVIKLVSFTGIGGIFINAILLIMIANGVRAAWALRKGIVDPEAEAEIFT